MSVALIGDRRCVYACLASNRSRTEDEPRWLVVGQIDGRHWSVVVTYREDRVRIISARRSRKEEVALHEG